MRIVIWLFNVGVDIMTKLASSSHALSLYRQLMRYGQKLQFTDKEYFSKRIRGEYEKNKSIGDKNLIDKQLHRGEQLLNRNRFL